MDVYTGLLYTIIAYMALGVAMAELAVRSKSTAGMHSNAYPIIVMLWLPFVVYVVYNMLRRHRR